MVAVVLALQISSPGAGRAPPAWWHAPQDVVFDFLADLRNERGETPESCRSKGRRQVRLASVAGSAAPTRCWELENEVVECERPRRLSFRGRGARTDIEGAVHLRGGRDDVGIAHGRAASARTYSGRRPVDGTPPPPKEPDGGTRACALA